ncbi:sulfite exporter TauE/SafE family protein [Chloroflexota bacterium]
MEIVPIIILLGTGVGVGFASGLLGVGGGFIMTPVQYLLFTNMGISANIALKMAFGTSLLVILPTVVSGTWRHHKKRAVWWKAALVMGPCGAVAAFGGATLATYLPEETLKIVFAVVVLASGIRMLIRRPLESEQEAKYKPWLWIAWAIPIGLITGLTGLGGGVVAVPVMVLALKFKMHNAVATSLAMIIFNSAGGVIGYIINGLGVPDLPAYSIGYVNLPAWFLLAVTSIGMAQVGAMAAHKIPARQLRWIFIVVQFYVALRMMGVFDWLGWPV